MIKPEKFSPRAIKEEPSLGEIDVEYLAFENQEKMFDLDPLDPKSRQEIDHADRNQTMKERWSWILGIYLAVFTILMFLTLWFSGKWCMNSLEPTTLNFLITVGFAKVIVVVWAIVSHLFPSKK